jgi:hypothetical protein
VLDPACGSGSFLRALVARLRTDWPDMPVQQIANQITGIDVHPLSVQIAKTTLLLALGEGVARAKSPVTLNVYLANTLFLSQDEGKKTLYTSGHHFLVRVDDQRLPLDMTPFIGQPDRFVKAIELAQHFVDANVETEQPFAVFEKALRARVPTVDIDASLVARTSRHLQSHAGGQTEGAATRSGSSCCKTSTSRCSCTACSTPLSPTRPG